jgi:cell division protein FtsB
MPHFTSQTLEVIVYLFCAAVLLFFGFRAGRWVGGWSASRSIAEKEKDLFTAQKGFKNLYEQEVAALRAENEKLKAQVQTLTGRVEDYRKKAAGFGGLFSTAGKRADAMYALLLENEALEEALYSQNEKLKQERTDALREQLRSTGYRRVLMSQLLNDDRIKGYVSEIMADDKRLPGADASHVAALPDVENTEKH